MSLDRTIAPEVKPLPRLILPQWETIDLPSGIRLVKLVDSSCSAPVFSIRALVSGAGVQSSASYAAGMFLPSVIIHGADNLDTNALNEIIERSGAFVRPKTGSRYADIELRGLTDSARDAVEVFAAMLAKPRFEAENFDAYRQMMVQNIEIRSMESKFIAGREASIRYWGEGHPRLDFPVADDFRRLTRNDVVELHRRAFTPGHITLFVSGDVTDGLIAVIEDAMGRYFPGEGAHADAQLPPAPPAALQAGEYHLKGVNDEQAAIRIVRPSIERSHPDYCLLRMAVIGLGGYFGSRLTRRIREEMGLTYGIFASLAGDESYSSIGISTQCKADKVAEALAEIRSETERFVAEPPRGEELSRLRGFMTSDLTDSFNTPIDILNWATTFQLVGTDRSYFERNQDAIFGATPEDLSRVMSTHLLTAPEIAVTVS